MRADRVTDRVLEILIARKRDRDLEHEIEFRSLDDGASALPLLTAERADAATRALDEVHVAARKLLGNGAGALALGAAVVGPSLAGDGESERGDGPAGRGDTDEPRIDQLRKFQESLLCADGPCSTNLARR